MENHGLVNILAIDLDAPVDVSVEFEDMDEDDSIKQEINLNEDKYLNIHQLSRTGQGDTNKCELQNCKNINGIKVPEKEIHKGSTQNAKVHHQNEQFTSDETETNGPQTEFGVQITQIKKVVLNEKLRSHETEMNGPQTDIDLNKKHESQRDKLQTEINQTESQPDLPGHAIFVPNVNVKDFKEIMEFISKKANNYENSGNFLETSNNIGSLVPPHARNPVPQAKNPVAGIAALQTFIQNEHMKSGASFNNETSNQNFNYKSPTSLNEDYSFNNCPNKPNDPNFVDFEKYMGLVLKTASEHAIRVIEYYYKYYDLKTTSNKKKETESALSYYIESKEYLFSLSFSVISNVMVPQETNGAFMNKFVNDCLQLCGNRYSYGDFAVIYKEMITWAKNKAKLIETQTILTNAANLEMEMESLISQKSLQSRATYSHTQGTLNPTTNPILLNMLNNVNTSITSNAGGHPVVPTRSNINKNNPSMQNNMFYRNMLQKVNPSNMSNVVGNPGVTTGSNINPNNPGMYNNMLNANMLRNVNPSNMSNVVGNPGVTTGSNINPKNPGMYNNMLNANMLRNVNPSNMSYVGNPGVTSGSNINPNNPGMQNNMLYTNMLRNVNPSNMSNVVGNHDVPTVSNINPNNPGIKNTMLYTNMLKNINASIMSNVGRNPGVLTGLNINQKNPNMPNNMLYPTMKWPVNSSEHSTLSRADLKHARIKKKSSNLPAVRCYPFEKITYPPHDSIPQTTLLKTPVPRNVRVDIDVENGNRNINISFIPNENPVPTKDSHPHPKLCTNGSIEKISGIIPPGNNTPNYSIPLINNLMQPQQEQNALEATRSQSRDSGFMSPLSLNSPVDPTNTDKIDNTQNNVNPLITHVTSLNPNASYIDSSACSVCKGLTNLKCLGCYRVYYCSYQCQKSDWKFHRNFCSDRMIQNSK